MVSSGISTSVSPIRTVDNGAIGASGKGTSSGFGDLMVRAMAGVDVNAELATNTKPSDKANVSNTSTTDAAERIPKKEDIKASKKPEVKAQAKSENKVEEADELIREEIKSKFGVTDEEIEAVLETLGITMADLLDKSNLMDFVVELTGMDSAVDMLVMGDMSAKVEELFGFVEETFEKLADEYGVTVGEMKEIFTEVLQEMADVPADVNALESKSLEKLVANVAEDATTQINQNEVVAKSDVEERLSEGIKQKAPDNVVVAENADATDMPEIKVVDNKQPADSKQYAFEGNHNQDMAGQQFISNLTEAVTESFNVNNVNVDIDPMQLINQIVERARVTINQEVTSMEMMLNPESLGKINLNISVREGVVTASIVAQNEAVKEAIESQIVILKENFNNQGLKVEAVEVTVESHAFEANANQSDANTFSSQQEEAKKKANRPLRVDSLNDLSMEDLSDEEKLVLDMMVENGNQINFKA